MTRKRKRSAYMALSTAKVYQYKPHQSSVTRTSTTLHITPTPPEAITQFDSTPSPTTPSTTPLIIRASDIASIQAALGFSPDTPANSTIYLGPEEQRQCRALINSPKIPQQLPQQLPQQTPRTPRRLSLGSAVTPIPLNFESPEKESQPDELEPTPVRPVQPQQLFTPQHPVPSPITPHQQVLVPSPPPSPDVYPRTPIEDSPAGLIDPPPLTIVSKPNNTGALNRTPLFTTASGKPLPPNDMLKTPHPKSRLAPLFTTASGKPLAPLALPNYALKTPNHPQSHAVPLFTTGKGKPLAPLTSTSLTKAATFLNTTSIAPPPNNLVRSLFTTGKGKPVHIPKPTNPPSTAFRTPLTGKSNVSLFTTGSGKRVSVPSNPSSALLLRPPPSPHTPSMPENALRKTLFSDPPQQSNTKRPSPSGMTLRNSAGRPLRRGRSGPALKTTPFRRPRRVVSKKAPNTAKVPVGNPLIPRWDVPRLSKDGSIFCDSPMHARHHSARSSEGVHVPEFLFAPNCLQSCLPFVFEKHAFGAYECLPSDVIEHFQLKDLASFSVGNVLSWIRTLFPAAVEKPASCFGSAAWTRMSYSVAVWKLARLENNRSDGGKSADHSFLSAANVIREILRRIKVEWHSNSQPHLLRIMRKDSSAASHVVLVLSGFELGAEGRIIVFLSDGWYLVRAVVDETIQTRIWNGNLRVGDKISIVGACLQEFEGSRVFFFGDGDELGTSVLRLFANGVRKVPNKDTRLGRHPSYPWTGSLLWIKDDGGKCPMLKVVILRSYPVFYMEAPSSENTDPNGSHHFVSRRAEGEDRARAIHQEKIREKLQADVDNPNKNKNDASELQLTEQRNVRTVKEILICGIKDDPAELPARKLLRIYNVSETLQALMNKEGHILLLSQVIPKKNRWICKPDGVRHAPKQKAVETVASDALLNFPRKICSVPELRNGFAKDGDDFDGVFLVLYVTSDCANRFAYLTSAPAENINVLALQLSATDSECLPRALQFKQSVRSSPSIVGIRDAKYCYRDSNLDILHANSTMRTSFLTSRSLSGMSLSSPLRLAYDDLESRVRGKEPQLDVLRDAVISFASGNRSSVSAYFTSTQDM